MCEGFPRAGKPGKGARAGERAQVQAGRGGRWGEGAARGLEGHWWRRRQRRRWGIKIGHLMESLNLSSGHWGAKAGEGEGRTQGGGQQGRP